MSIQACEQYSRPAGVMGGPCLNCGLSQPEHANWKPVPREKPKRILTTGQPVPKDSSHTHLRPDGQQIDYVVLSPEERAKGFVKPVRRSYVHATCGCKTDMGNALAETYARDPHFYSGTFCVGCGAHFPLSQFNWVPDGEPMDPCLQEAWAIEDATRRKREGEEWRDRRIADLRRELTELEREGGA